MAKIMIDISDNVYKSLKEEIYPIPNPEKVAVLFKALVNKGTEVKQGKWIKYGTPRDGDQHYQCTNCRWYVNFGQWGDIYTKQFKFCPNCGCRMEASK